MSRLDRKVALITGAARGIDAAIARAFITEGARVWVTDLSDETGHKRVTELGPNATFAHLDVREEADWSRVVAEVVADAGRPPSAITPGRSRCGVRRKGSRSAATPSTRRLC